jgi:uncharacterized membrane protein YjjP (DUF1212 family)
MSAIDAEYHSVDARRVRTYIDGRPRRPNREGVVSREPVLAARSREVERFVLTLGRALHAYGSPAHRVEATLTRLSEILGEPGQFFVVPTSLMARFGGPDEAPRQHLERVEPGRVDLERLEAVDGIAAAVARGDLGPRGGSSALAALTATPNRYGPATTALAMGLVSASAARIFGGGAAEVWVAGLAGLAAAGVVEALAGLKAARLGDAAAALVVSALVLGATVAGVPVAVPIAVVAGLISFVPGFTLTVAATEIATGHVVAGTARLAAGATTLLMLAVGVSVSMALLQAGAPLSGAAASALPGWTGPAALVTSGLGLTVLFRASPVQAPRVVLGAGFGYGAAVLGSAWLGPVPGALMAAAAVTAGSNALSRWTDRPATVTQVPGLMMLVPGSTGFRSVIMMLGNDVIPGVEAGFGAMLAAAALAAGVLLGSLLVTPRRAEWSSEPSATERATPQPRPPTPAPLPAPARTR